MSDINLVACTGRLTRDPELRTLPSGTDVLNFGIAVNDSVMNKQTNEWEDRPNFFECSVFGKRAVGLSKFLCKGMLVFIEGKLRWSSWEKDGQKRSRVDIVVNELKPPQRPKDSGGQTQYQPAQQTQSTQQVNNTVDDYDESIPF